MRRAGLSGLEQRTTELGEQLNRVRAELGRAWRLYRIAERWLADQREKARKR